MALTFAHYTAPGLARPLAAGATVVLTAVNLRGIGKTAGLTKLIVAIVLAALAVFVAGALVGGTVSVSHLSVSHTRPFGVLQAGGFLFFAFACTARISTLVAEVVATYPT